MSEHPETKGQAAGSGRPLGLRDQLSRESNMGICW